MPWSEIGFIGRGRKYLEREISVNAENVQSAVERQRWSGNNLDERVWWDTESYNPNGSDIEYRINEAGDIIPISNFRD